MTIAAVLVPLAGCAYLRDRGRDFTDVVDLKGGAGGIGLGVKARATEFVGTGAGAGGIYHTREEIGRHVWATESEFVGLVVFTLDGRIRRLSQGLEISFFGVRLQDDTALRPWAWFRFGSEVVLPGTRGGLFVNLGEFVDFLGGLAGLDPVGDDGVEIGASLEEDDHESRRERDESPPPRDEAPEAK